MRSLKGEPDPPDSPAMAPLTVDARGLARLLNVSTSTVARLSAAGKLPRPVRLGRCTRWPVAVIERWLLFGCPDRRSFEALSEGRASHHG